MKEARYSVVARPLLLELVKLQRHWTATGRRLLVLFEGRDVAGKGGAIKRVLEPLDPLTARAVEFGRPSERERGSWYFQRYIAQLPARGEIVCFNHSWYARPGVERVLGQCTPDELEEFYRAAPELERMLVRAGITVVKFFYAVSRDEQARRLDKRIADPLKKWQVTPQDLEAQSRWDDYTRAFDEMFARTSIPEAPWMIVDADDKRHARLATISHLLSRMEYPGKDEELVVPDRTIVREWSRED